MQAVLIVQPELRQLLRQEQRAEHILLLRALSSMQQQVQLILATSTPGTYTITYSFTLEHVAIRQQLQ